MIRYYKLSGSYIAVTDQSPAGFEGVVFVGRGGPLDAVEDQLIARGIFQNKTPVDVADVPPEWVAALGYHKVDDFPLLDEKGDNLVAEIPVRVPVQEVSNSTQENPGWIWGLLVGAFVTGLLWSYL
jgi:hypothetical protein